MVEEDTLREELYEAMRDTLETMAFAEVMPDEGEALRQHENDTDLVWARIGIASEQMRCAELVIPAELVAALADTMYAGGAPEGQNIILDTVAELANTLTGRFMLNLGEKAGAFTLQVPESGTGVPPISGKSLICHCLVDETHPVRAVLMLAE